MGGVWPLGAWPTLRRAPPSTPPGPSRAGPRPPRCPLPARVPSAPVSPPFRCPFHADVSSMPMSPPCPCPLRAHVPSLPVYPTVSLPTHEHTHTSTSGLLFPLPRFLMELCTKRPRGAEGSGACGAGYAGEWGGGAGELLPLLPLPAGLSGTPRHMKTPRGDRKGRSPTKPGLPCEGAVMPPQCLGPPWWGEQSPPTAWIPIWGDHEARPRVCKLSTSLFCFSSSILSEET